MTRRGLVAPIILLLAASIAPMPWAEAQGPVSIGTNPPGSAFYAVGSGVAKVVSDAGAVKMAVQPYSGSSTFLPLLESGEIEFGVNNAVDMTLAYRGPGFKIGGRNPFPHTPAVRLLLRGAPFHIGLLVRKDSPIRQIADVRGQRVTGEYPAHLAVWYNMFGLLASAGLTWSDVTVVPVPAVNDGVNALVQGRADVTAYAIGAAKIKEADAAIGVRHVSLDCSPEGERRLRAAVPGYYPAAMRGGSATGIVEDTCVLAYDLYLTVGKGVPDQTVEGVLRALWERHDQLAKVHPLLSRWRREHAVHADVTLPYHPAAVRFYRAQGVWTDQMEEAQQRLAALKP